MIRGPLNLFKKGTTQMTQNQPNQKIQVDDKFYTVQLYNPEYGLTLWATLLRLVGPSIVSMISSMKGSVGGKLDLSKLTVSDMDFEKIGDSVMTLLNNVPPEDLVPLMKKILQGTYMTEKDYHNDPVVEKMNDPVFQGKYKHLFKLTAKVLGVQYPDFLSVIGKGLKGLPPGAGAPKATT